jgi:hypothetical protein
MRKLLVAFLLLGVSLAYGKTYSLRLLQPSIVGATELKPGSYKLELEGSKVSIRNGEESTEVTVRVETAARKFPVTTIRYANGDGKYRVEEICVGGTNMRLVLN